MNAMTRTDTRLRFPPDGPIMPRPVHWSVAVAAFYVLLVLGAPWMVRYAPAAAIPTMVQFAERPPLLRCASAPEYGLPCGGPVPGTARDVAQAALTIDTAYG